MLSDHSFLCYPDCCYRHFRAALLTFLMHLSVNEVPDKISPAKISTGSNKIPTLKSAVQIKEENCPITQDEFFRLQRAGVATAVSQYLSSIPSLERLH